MPKEVIELSNLLALAQRALGNGELYAALDNIRRAAAKAETLECKLRTGETPKIGDEP